MNDLHGMLSDLSFSATCIPFKLLYSRDTHYHRTPGDFGESEECVLTRSVEISGEQAHALIIFELSSHLPTYLRFVGRVVSTSFKDRGGQPIPHVSSTFVPLYFADALAMQQMLGDMSALPDGNLCYHPFQSITAAFRAERHLPSDTQGITITFRPFDSLFDGRTDYTLPDERDLMPQLPIGQLQPDDLAVYAISVQRFYIPQQGRYTKYWTAALKLDSITLLQHSSETTSPAV
ncbi:hypothetical protein BV25DRAFT_1843270 [Artomyces pyxidatus]|uniref:Uncharacterized protein n=1 Tax=Artomyces pyxidatus TaxID=48021 RepID=A0ACB8SGH1_9AGAM|nr:hypothetical protein BV25DRAFT_1843270 [Artomyces pyxidatus]